MEWKNLAHFLYGRGFWYANPLEEIRSLNDEQLLWVPTEGALPILWHVGHIATREAMHIGSFIMGLPQDELIPPECEVFLDWSSVDGIRNETDGTAAVLRWVQETREAVHGWIDNLTEEDLQRIATDEEPDGALTVAHWLAITVAHTALHVGRIQGLRAQVEGIKERAC